MKKYIYLLIILAAAGSFLSAVLLIQHYQPAADFGILSCGVTGSCTNVSHSPYSVFLGIPVAAFGLLYYLVILIGVLVADYAHDFYLRAYTAAGTALTVLSVAVDIALALLLVYLGEFCPLCVATYAINIIVLAVFVLLYSRLRKEQGLSIKSVLKEFKPESSDRKAASALAVITLFLLPYSLYQTNTALSLRHPVKIVTQQEIDKYAEEFYKKPVEKLDLPESRIVLGNPDAELSIHVFSDFLCSACGSFYDKEKQILDKFDGKVKFVYYHYPLDSDCNPDVQRTVYDNSCIASSAVEAAASLGVLKDYVDTHFASRKEYRKKYSSDWAVKIFDMVSGGSALNADKVLFEKAMKLDKTDAQIRRHMAAAIRNKVEATPTLFIGGRRILGGPKAEMFEEIVRRELETIKNK